VKRYAKVLAGDPTGETAEGETFVLAAALEWQPVEWLDPWDCEHVETMCATCAKSWSYDHHIEFPDGIDVPDSFDDDELI
jgi:hypothetical protein